MKSIALENFRCFHENQTARLAPLTLLVGENSTGKTSFMAMIRVLWDVSHGDGAPDFKDDPYDLGSFDEIAHHRGGRAGRAEAFQAGFGDDGEDEPYRLEITFKKKGVIPVIERKRLSSNENWIEACFDDDRSMNLRVGTCNGAWKWQADSESDTLARLLERSAVPSFVFFLLRLHVENGDVPKLKPEGGSPGLTPGEWEKIHKIFMLAGSQEDPFRRMRPNEGRPYASAPVRSKPRRTYDPARSAPDPEGDHVPMYLANLSFHDKRKWSRLKKGLERIGIEAGLFDEVAVRSLGRKETEPFQLQVRKSGGGLKGPWRNLIDVGYGVSQALPVITELLREDAAGMFLLQQPEVHLHPRAQAALGSLFCRVARNDRQLIVETHSDYLLDRVRMDVRDEQTPLGPEDVSILFFERGDLDVHIHSLRLDEQGNVLDAPDSYRKFFMDEVQRSLGL